MRSSASAAVASAGFTHLLEPGTNAPFATYRPGTAVHAAELVADRIHARAAGPADADADVYKRSKSVLMAVGSSMSNARRAPAL